MWSPLVGVLTTYNAKAMLIGGRPIEQEGVHTMTVDALDPRIRQRPRGSLLFASTCGALGLIISLLTDNWWLIVLGIILTVGPMLTYLSEERRRLTAEPPATPQDPRPRPD